MIDYDDFDTPDDVVEPEDVSPNGKPGKRGRKPGKQAAGKQAPVAARREVRVQPPLPDFMRDPSMLPKRPPGGRQ